LAFLKGEAKVNVRKNSHANVPQEVKKAPQAVKTSVGSYTVVVNGEKYDVQVVEGEGSAIDVSKITKAAPIAGESSDLAKEELKDEAKSSDDAVDANATKVKAELPGSVSKVFVKEGDEVKEGQILFLLEAMKMETEISAPKSGVIAKIFVSQGQAVEGGGALCAIK
jgi:pyruvate carboxylase subunit B